MRFPEENDVRFVFGLRRYLVVLVGLFLELFEIFGGDFDVFEVVRAVGAEDGFFVALAEEEDEVTGMRKMKGLADGGIAVEIEEEIFILDFAGFFGAFEEWFGDFLRVFVARVVFGDDDSVGVFAEDFAAKEAGGFVAAAGATVEGDNFAGVVLDGGEDLLKGVRSVSVIDDDLEILTFVETVHTAFDGF